MDAKRQNKLLKLAIGRLQNELERKEGGELNEQSILGGEGNVKVFLTENQNQVPEGLLNSGVSKQEQHPYISQFGDGTTAPTSILDPGYSKISNGLAINRNPRRIMTRSPASKYRHIATENIKFSKFLELIFKSKMK